MSEDLERELKTKITPESRKLGLVKTAPNSKAHADESIWLSFANSNKLVSRRAFMHGGIIGLSGLAMAGCMGSIVSRGDLEITRRTLAIPNLPEVWKGKTITLASDIHSSPFMNL